ncbi:MAG: DsbC family protein [Proteobacteria bacterium]|nr:DsbC family protein [Pseudomonadota bacterium]
MKSCLNWVQNLVCVLIVSAAPLALAGDSDDGSILRERLVKLRPDLPVQSVSSTPLPGIFALELPGGTYLYGTADGKYLFAGDMYELTDTSLVNLAENRRSDYRRDLMEQVNVKDMVVFQPKGPTKAVINVFTDVDCGYCRKLHQEMAELNGLGIEVRYLAYPRAGVDSDSYFKIVSAWCADDQKAAITSLKLGDTIPSKTCANPVADQYELGQKIGISGTPAIVLADGRLLPGYMPAESLANAIGL